MNKFDMSQACATSNHFFVNKKRFYSLIALCFCAFSSFGCSLEVSLESLSEDITSIFSKPTMAEVTPASRQNSYTSNRGFQVQASLSFKNTESMITTARGYKVQTTVQGTIFKEQ